MTKPKEIFTPDSGDNREILSRKARAAGKISAETKRRKREKAETVAEADAIRAERTRREAARHEEELTRGIPETDQ